jgi:hypothetical protein
MRRRSKLRVLGPLLLIAALVTEMRKDPAARTGTGKVAGFVPYDFRPPTFERVKESVWDPNSDRLLTPSPFGVGWTINLAEALKLWKKARSGAQAPERWASSLSGS